MFESSVNISPQQALDTTTKFFQSSAANLFSDMRGAASNPYMRMPEYSPYGVTRMCKVMLAFPTYNYYIVREVDTPYTTYGASWGSKLSIPWGVRCYQTIPPGAYVTVYKQNELDKLGYIQNIIEQKTSLGFPFPIELSTGLSSGSFYDNYYSAYTSQNIKGLPIRAVNGYAQDLSCTGDYGVTSMTNGVIHIDPFMIMLKQTSMCGLWIFLLNQLTRLSGQNLELESELSSEFHYNLEGLSLHRKAIAVDVAHIFGSILTKTQYAEAISSSATDKYVRWQSPELSKVRNEHQSITEPVDFNRMSWYDYEELSLPASAGLFRGFKAPVCTRDDVYFYDSDDKVKFTGLSAETMYSDGTLCLESANSLHIYKRPFIPQYTPQEHLLSRDSAALAAETVSNAINPDVTINFSYDFINLNTKNTLLYYLNYDLIDYPEDDTEKVKKHVYNLSSSSYLLKNIKSYNKEGEEEASDEFYPSSKLSDLSTKTMLDLPPYHYAETETKQSKTRIYNTTAGISIENDGSVIIRDGYGGSITMTGGHIYLDAPGDIQVRSGRTGVIMSGNDTIIKANKSIDITANTNDVRIKAENNMELLSGIEKGHMLLQNKAKYAPSKSLLLKYGEDRESSGIIFNSASTLQSYGNSCYTKYENKIDYVLGSHVDAVGTKEVYYRDKVAYVANNDVDTAASSAIISSNGFECSGNGMFDGYIKVKGTVAVGSSITAYGGINATGSLHVAGTVGKLGKSTVSGTGFSEEKPDDLKSNSEASSGNTAGIYAEYASTFSDTLLNEEADNGYFSSAYVTACCFTYRTEEQYGTLDYLTMLPLWDRINKAQSISADTWTENFIDVNGVSLSPYPGYKALNEIYALYSGDYACDKGSAVDESIVEQTLVLNGNFPITKLKKEKTEIE